ncbi:BLUF domain-containing protein [uncultured Dokdonia sp.]|uniref:BLUF domain-containing protein n=1 Tax=uncultured Dokdonia sp. TaxID=575653 RepID=UPI0026313DF6|nr:BLUF domain-containing protein [uncultured Dokdonia sp.]
MYTICYFSKVAPDLTDEEIQEIFDHTYHQNNEKGVCGILLHTMGNFFQVLEGDEAYLTDLYENRIKTDPRHHSIFEVIHKEGSDPVFTSYSSQFLKVEDSEVLDDIKAYVKKHAIVSSTSDKISRLLNTVEIVAY